MPRGGLNTLDLFRDSWGKCAGAIRDPHVWEWKPTVDYLVLVLLKDTERMEHIDRIVDSSLQVLKVRLCHLFFVFFVNLFGYLSSIGWSHSFYLILDLLAQKNQHFVLNRWRFIVVKIRLALHCRNFLCWLKVCFQICVMFGVLWIINRMSVVFEIHSCRNNQILTVLMPNFGFWSLRTEDPREIAFLKIQIFDFVF